MLNVIIPAYNCRKTLSKTLSSLVAQTDNDFCVTIIDDHSTEDIKDIVDGYSKILNINYIRNKQNLGCGMSRQVGIDNTNCSYFTFLDSDDMFMPYTIETFNSIINTCPDTEYVHSYFYEQVTIDDNPALILHKDGYTWCHGKLYNKESIDKYGMKNSPLIRWADDSYFNSMCSELLECKLISIPTVLWCNNKESVMRRKDLDRDLAVKEDFLTAMKLSIDFVLQHKDCVTHLDRTIEVFLKQYDLNEKEKELMKILKER